ncbi:MlaD family protein [Rhodococcus phenolicus]|uniref:MlaD family protein n=1 Tax=Rhodococcus phenolicus TaxID=263849 RepID=UPI0009EE5599|nr:MlaD family protein [Rhodococcus phenolicus]
MTTPPSLSSRRGIRLAALAVAAAGTVTVSACGYGIQDLPVGRSAGAGAFDVEVQLPSADGIVLGADVRYGQQIVGRVASLSTATTGANLQVSLQRELEVPSNVLVSVEIPSALGSPYLRLVTPVDAASDRLSDGDVIAVENTDLGPRVETMLAALGNVVSGSGMDQLATVVDELNVAFTGRSDRVQSLADTATDLMTRAIDQQTAFDEAMTLAADVTRRMADEEQAMDTYLANTAGAVDVLVAQRDSISALLDSTTRLAGNVQALTGAVPQGTAGFLIDAETVASTLQAFNDRMGSTLVAMNAFMDAFGRSVRGDYLVFDGALEIPESIDTVLTGGYFTGTPPEPSPTSLQDLLGGGNR